MTNDEARQALQEQLNRAASLYVKKDYIVLHILHTGYNRLNGFLRGKKNASAFSMEEVGILSKWLDECERGEHNNDLDEWHYQSGKPGCNRVKVEHNMTDGIKGSRDKPEIGKMVGCEEECDGCIYLASFSASSDTKFCNYMEVAGQMRGCPGGKEYCLRYSTDQTQKRSMRKALTVRDNDEPKRKPAKPLSITQIDEMYSNGMSDGDIAAAIGCSKSNISQWRYTRHLPPNIKPRGKGVGGRPRDQKMETERMELYNKGMTDAQIADALSTKAQTICQWRLKRKLPSNGRAGRPKKHQEPQEADKSKEDESMSNAKKPDIVVEKESFGKPVTVVVDDDLTNEINQLRRERDELKDLLGETNKTLTEAQKYIEELEQTLEENSENLKLAHKKVAVSHAEATEAKEIIFRLVREEMGLP